MHARRSVAALFACLALPLAGSAAAQQPRMTNGRVVAQPAAGNLDATVRRLAASQTEPAWIGYSVPTLADSARRLCCNGDTWISGDTVISNGRLATCGLEPGDRASRTSHGQPVPNQGPIRLEGPETMTVMLRVEDTRVQRIRIFSPDCELDAGGRTIYWLDPVAPPDSVALLATFVARSDVKSDRVTDGALAAIAMHRDEAADAALERLGTSAGSPESVRRKVAFWLGSARGRRGFDTLVTIASDDRSEEVRKSAMFGLSQSADERSIPELIRFARQDPSARVRGEAIFWLAQTAGRRAAGEITAAIDNDPDTEVKKRAVFALSQLPKDEGIPLLIKVARTNQNPAVRKQAMFWLGQSRDPRALDFFAEVLAK